MPCRKRVNGPAKSLNANKHSLLQGVTRIGVSIDQTWAACSRQPQFTLQSHKPQLQEGWSISYYTTLMGIVYKDPKQKGFVPRISVRVCLEINTKATQSDG